MNLLAIDASTECASVALLTAGCVTEREQPVPKQHALVLLPMIRQLMADAGLTFNQLDALVFGRGPGSFTGLRIACSITKGLAFAHDLPVYPASTLASIANEALYRQPSAKSCSVLAVMDARMNQLYWTSFDGNSGAEECVSDPEHVSVAGDGPVLLAGCAYEAYRARLPAAILARIQAEESCYPRASAMLRMAVAGELQAVSAAAALPVYVRNQIVQGEARG